MTQRIFEHVTRPEQFVFYRSERHLLQVCNLLVGQLSEVAELNELTIVSRQVDDRFVDRYRQLFVLQVAVRRDAVVGNLAFLAFFVVRSTFGE